MGFEENEFAAQTTGHNDVSVYIVAEGAQRVVDFLKETFEAGEIRRFETPDTGRSCTKAWAAPQLLSTGIVSP